MTGISILYTKSQIDSSCKKQNEPNLQFYLLSPVLKLTFSVIKCSIIHIIITQYLLYVHMYIYTEEKKSNILYL